MTLTIPPSAQIEIWRQKVKDGTITNDELREAIRLIREGRMAAGAAKPKKAKTPSENVTQQDTDDLLKELEDL